MRIEYLKSVKRQVAKLDSQTRQRIYDCMAEVQQLENPRSRGKAMTGRFSECWCYRVGDYRILCKIHDDILTVTVVKIGHRSSVYKTPL